MLSKVHSLGLAGIAGYEVETECYIGTGLPAFELVGQPHHREPRPGGDEEIRYAQ